MSGNKYQTLVNGRETLVSSTQISSGASNANQIVALDPSGHLDPSVLPIGVGPDVSVLPATESLSAGDYVNIYNNSGVSSVRKADSTNDRPAHGFTKAAVISGANATVYFEGANDARSGLTLGARYYLSAAGGIQVTPPALPTDVIHQFLGIAVSATAINTDIDEEIVL